VAWAAYPSRSTAGASPARETSSLTTCYWPPTTSSTWYSEASRQDLEKDQLKIVPYIHSFNNKLTDDDNFKQYSFPDLKLSDAIPSNSEAVFSMVAGEFVEVYSKKPCSPS
jgi:hypothetical protein